MRSDLLCTCQGDRVEGIIHKTSQNSRRITRLSVETALSASLCPFALNPSAKICENGQEWVNNGSTFESSWTLRKPLACFSFSRNMTRIPMNMMIMMQLWHHKPNNAKQCKSKLMRSHVATAHAIHAMPPSDSSERLQICAELPCHASWKMWEVQKVQIQTQFLFWNHALGKERFSKAVQRLLFMIFSIVFLALYERPLWTFPKSRHRLMGLCVSGSDLKRVTRLRHPVAPGTWESHQVWSSVEEADSSSAPVALGLADNRRILSHKCI